MLDPLGAAEAAGAKLSVADRAMLAQSARQVELASVLPAGVELVALDVEASTSKRPRRIVPPTKAQPKIATAPKTKAKRGGERR